MKMTVKHILVAFLFCAAIPVGFAQHYPAGGEGIKAGSLPGPGFNFEDDNSFYFADHRPGFGGQFNNVDRFTYTQSPRMTWVSDFKLFDANLALSVRVPIECKELSYNYYVFGSGGFPGPVPGSPPPPPPAPPTLAKYTMNHAGLGDIEVRPLLMRWQFDRLDVSSDYSFWVPTGEFNKTDPTGFSLGQGYWTHSIMFGLTWYPDTEKSWAVSVLNHYEINTEQYSSLFNGPGGSIVSIGTTLGNIYTLEWALSKSFKIFDVGLTGYYQQQVTDTEGPTVYGPTWLNEHIHVAGIGPEIGCSKLPWGLSGSFRYAYEFSAMDHPQGHLINLTIKKSF